MRDVWQRKMHHDAQYLTAKREAAAIRAAEIAKGSAPIAWVTDQELQDVVSEALGENNE